LAFGPSHPDIRSNMDWGERFFQYGAAGFYNPNANVWDYTWPNKPILTIYLYAGIWQLFNFIFDIFWKINVSVAIFPSIIIKLFESKLYEALLKMPSILADFGISYFIYKVFADWGKKSLGRTGAFVFLVNPVIWYNSAVWGQTDAWINFWGLLSFYYLAKKKYFWSMLFIAISLLTKLSLLIFVPFYLLVLIKQKIEIKNILINALVVGVIVIVLAVPFSDGKNPVSFLIWLYTHKVFGQQLQIITANAFNIWVSITGINQQPHTLKFIILNYQVWGYLLFISFMVPVFYYLYKTKAKDYMWWGLALIAFGAFMLLTNMHERYLYPLFPYLTILAVKYKKIMPILIITSFINLANLYNFWWYPKITLLISFLSFGDRIMPRILGLVLFVVFLWFYREFLLQKTQK
jgi:dolichyl-phosphate-mannose-protein mannosyltransferase